MPGHITASLADLDDILKDITEDPKPKTPVVEDLLDAAMENETAEESDSEQLPEKTIAEAPPIIGNGAYVRVDDDGMQAWIFLNPPKEGEDFYSKEKIMDFLFSKNVKAGFHTSNISAIAKKHVYGREILVARGENADSGSNGWYEYFFDTNSRKKPTIREDGTVDYSSMSRLTNVKSGTVVAIYHPAVKNHDGFDVYGNVIPSKPPKELPGLKGREITNEKDPNVYVAKVSGKIELKQNKIDIKNVHEVRGDVDLVTGKVEFFGDIHIQGNVGAGVMIRASRNVTIDGTVESATIYAGGDVVISKGITGGQKGIVIAKGNVCAEFIELATVEAAGNIRSNTFVNANVYAEGQVVADGKNGVILGGEVRGLRGVTAMTMGNASETKTFVASGYSSEDYSKYVDINQKESTIQQALSDVVDKMTETLRQKKLGKDINSDATDRLLLALNEKKDELFGQLDRVRSEKEKLTEVIENGKDSVIVCNDKIYRGVTICVEGTNFLVIHNSGYMRYKNEAGKIVARVLIPT